MSLSCAVRRGLSHALVFIVLLFINFFIVAFLLSGLHLTGLRGLLTGTQMLTVFEIQQTNLTHSMTLNS